MAVYTYETPEPGDLTFSAGDLILVSSREGEWWSGSIGDQAGVFPSNYVKPKESDVRTVHSPEPEHNVVQHSIQLLLWSTADIKLDWKEETRWACDHCTDVLWYCSSTVLVLTKH